MTNRGTDDNRELAAGDFSTWLGEIQGALRGERSSEVPCGSCTACCTASQFIHIAPDEADTLAHIPLELVFPAPRLPRGHVLLGYNQHGHCPMLIDNRCSIYEHRPRTCRTYDCRVFPATGLAVDDDDTKVLIAEQAKRWRFTFANEAGRIEQEAVVAAARYLQENLALLPDGSVKASTTHRAVLAIQVHEAFLERDEATGQAVVITPQPAVVALRIDGRSSSSSAAP